MSVALSVVVPAWNEADRIGATLDALRRIRSADGSELVGELIVVDDGSTDGTADEAARRATFVIRHAARQGKGAALRSGWMRASGDIVLFADADLGETAVHLGALVDPVLRGEADMAIARFVSPARRGGFGLVKRLAKAGIYRLTGVRLEAPLSGQRAVRRQLLSDVGGVPDGFGVEVGLTIDAVRLGYRLCEVPLPLKHRETGKTLSGFRHRGLQMVEVSRAMLARWRRTVP